MTCLIPYTLQHGDILFPPSFGIGMLSHPAWVVNNHQWWLVKDKIMFNFDQDLNVPTTMIIYHIFDSNNASGMVNCQTSYISFDSTRIPSSSKTGSDRFWKKGWKVCANAWYECEKPQHPLWSLVLYDSCGEKCKWRGVFSFLVDAIDHTKSKILPSWDLKTLISNARHDTEEKKANSEAKNKYSFWFWCH